MLIIMEIHVDIYMYIYNKKDIYCSNSNAASQNLVSNSQTSA